MTEYYSDLPEETAPCPIIEIHKIVDDATIPNIMTEGSACFDIRANLHTKYLKGYSSFNREEKVAVKSFGADNASIIIFPKSRVLVPTGLIFGIPGGYSMRIHPRSSIALKQGLSLANGEGIVDEDYVEETFVVLYNGSETGVSISHGERIAQAELVETIPVQFMTVEERPKQKTSRAGGFGSTGV